MSSDFDFNERFLHHFDGPTPSEEEIWFSMSVSQAIRVLVFEPAQERLNELSEDPAPFVKVQTLLDEVSESADRICQAVFNLGLIDRRPLAMVEEKVDGEFSYRQRIEGRINCSLVRSLMNLRLPLYLHLMAGCLLISSRASE